MTGSLDKSQFEKFADELANKYPIDAMLSAQDAMTDMLDYHLGMMPEYPEELMESPMPPDGITWLRTPQQRAWFFAAVKSGDVAGWIWVDAKKSTIYKPNPRNTVSVTYKEIKETVVVEPAHPEKIGGGRTGNLGRAKGRDVTTEDDAVIGYLGFDASIAPYAPWVVGDDFPGTVIGGENMYQAQIHVDRWWQFGGIIESNLEPGWAVFNQTFWEEFGKRIERYE